MRFVDTNVLLYAISRDPAEQDKAKRANDILADRDVVLSVQVLQEFYVQATRANRADAISHRQAVLLIESFRRFLAECRRVMKPGAVLRLACPDLDRRVHEYLEHADADRFMAELEFDLDRPRGLGNTLRRLASGGGRGHHWMYDGASLVRLLGACGFADARVVAAGETRMPEPGALNLGERPGDSVYVEAVRPHLTQS